MRKISIGSFPLIDINPKERKYMDSYLIKVLSDLLTVNQISSSIYEDRARFITPFSILEYFKKGKFNNTNELPEPDSNSMKGDRIYKAAVIKNAFKNTRNLYRAIGNDPFYKEYIFYPIYIEEPIKAQNGYTDYRYDFLILSNDLIKRQILDEITFDDRITMLFLVLKCLILPTEKLSDLGKTDKTFRMYFASFMETCKNENINPFDMFIKIIKITGKVKRKRAFSSGSLLDRAIGKVSPGKYQSKIFLDLFGTDGEIKNASFLININQTDINNYMQEYEFTPEERANFSTVNRQYAQAKTHEYGKVLSIIDALIAFNNQKNLVLNINETELTTKLEKVNSATGEMEDIHVNKDQLINDLETMYFRAFLDGIKKADAQAIAKTIGSFRNTNFITISRSKQQIRTEITQFEQDRNNVIREIQSNNTIQLKLLAAGVTINDGTLDAANLLDAQNLLRNDNVRLMQLDQNIKSSTIELVNAKDTTDIANELEIFIKANFSIDLELYKSQLTGLYAEVYSYFSGNDFNNDLVDNMDESKFKTLNIFKTKLSLTLMDIAKDFMNDHIEKFQTYIDTNFSNNPVQQKQMQNKLNGVTVNASTFTEFTYDNFITIFFNAIFKPVFRKYSNKSISEASRIKDLRAEKNPVLRKILNDEDLFKSFVINEETIIGAYDILHYIDTVKYEEGIIRNPVSKVTNKINKIQFMIKRLGLEHHPVFIVNDNKDITLSMPDHLSLTNTNFITNIPLQEFLRVCSINYATDLWNQNNMFGGIRNTAGYESLNNNVEAAIKSIESVNEDLKIARKANDKNEVKRLEKKIAQHNKEKTDNLAKLEAMGNTGEQYNYSSNMDFTKRDNKERVWNYGKDPREAQRYDQDMSHNGMDQNENRNILNQRENMDSLRQNNFNHPPQYQQPHQSYQPQQNLFSHPQVQNRMQMTGMNEANHNYGNTQPVPAQHNPNYDQNQYKYPQR